MHVTISIFTFIQMNHRFNPLYYEQHWWICLFNFDQYPSRILLKIVFKHLYNRSCPLHHLRNHPFSLGLLLRWEIFLLIIFVFFRRNHAQIFLVFWLLWLMFWKYNYLGQSLVNFILQSASLHQTILCQVHRSY